MFHCTAAYLRAAYIAAAAAMAATLAAAKPAQAAAPALPAAGCSFIGTWQDSTGYLFTFSSETSGIWGSQSGVAGYAGCPAPWRITVIHAAGLRFRARFADTNHHCGQSFTVAMVFASGCNMASGLYRNNSAGSGRESWTRVK